MSSPERPVRRLRREPPRFRHVAVVRVESLSPRLVRVTFRGPDLEGFDVDLPAASVRLLLPSPGSDQLVVPTWHGNEFLLPDGGRPAIRTFTPRRVDPGERELDVDVVVHGGGVASAWVAQATAGAAAAVSGPGRGYVVDTTAPDLLLVGDETAIPAISQLLEVVPASTAIQVHIEVAQPDGRLALPEHPRRSVHWYDLPPGAPAGDVLVDAVRSASIGDGTRVWAAGEAAAMQRIRRHLFDDRGLARTRATVRGYWKQGRAGDGEGSEP